MRFDNKQRDRRGSRLNIYRRGEAGDEHTLHEQVTRQLGIVTARLCCHAVRLGPRGRDGQEGDGLRHGRHPRPSRRPQQDRKPGAGVIPGRRRDRSGDVAGGGH